MNKKEDMQNLEDLSLEEIQEMMLRNLRSINLCMNIPIIYESNVELTETKLQEYKEKSKNYIEILRNMVIDNIKIEDIANNLVVWDTKLEIQQIADLIVHGNWIENIDDLKKQLEQMELNK